jgi:hypothetical protein
MTPIVVSILAVGSFLAGWLFGEMRRYFRDQREARVLRDIIQSCKASRSPQ